MAIRSRSGAQFEIPFSVWFSWTIFTWHPYRWLNEYLPTV